MIALMLAASAQAATLEDAWAAMERTSTEHRALEAQTDARETIVGQTLGTLGPKVSMSGAWTVNQFESSFDPSAMIPGAPPGDPIVIQAKEAFSGSATVVQPLFSGSALPGYRAAQASAGAARADEQTGQDDLKLAVAQVFWTVIASRERVAIATASQASAERHLVLVKARADLGKVRPTEVSRAEIEVLKATRDQLEARGATSRAEAEFSRWTGLPATEPLEKTAPPEVPHADLAAAQAAAAASPRVVAAEARAQAAHRMSLATSMGFLPSINGRFTEAFSENTGFAGKKVQWQAAITADWTLWDGGVRVAKMSEARTSAVAADAGAQREREVAVTETTQRWTDLAVAREALDIAHRERELTAATLKIAEESYALGALTEVDLSDARIALDGARLGEVRAEMSVELATLALLRATGSL